MAKSKTSFFCRECGSEHSKWMGKCSVCGQWNTISEEVIRIEKAPKWKKEEGKKQRNKPQAVHKMTSSNRGVLN